MFGQISWMLIDLQGLPSPTSLAPEPSVPWPGAANKRDSTRSNMHDRGCLLRSLGQVPALAGPLPISAAGGAQHSSLLDFLPDDDDTVVTGIHLGWGLEALLHGLLSLDPSLRTSAAEQHHDIAQEFEGV